MGIFFEQVNLFNRAPINLTVTFDGQEKTLRPGDNFVPEVVVSFAKNQNPVMGTQDPQNPHISGAQYLVGVKMPDGSAFHGDSVEPLTDDEWKTHLGKPCRTDEESAFQDKYGGDPKAKLVVHGKGRRSTANSRYEAGGSVAGDTAGFSGKE